MPLTYHEITYNEIFTFGTNIAIFYIFKNKNNLPHLYSDLFQTNKGTFLTIYLVIYNCGNNVSCGQKYSMIW